MHHACISPAIHSLNYGIYSSSCHMHFSKSPCIQSMYPVTPSIFHWSICSNQMQYGQASRASSHIQRHECNWCNSITLQRSFSAGVQHSNLTVNTVVLDQVGNGLDSSDVVQVNNVKGVLLRPGQAECKAACVRLTVSYCQRCPA